jgi:hypothetical protein
MYSFSLSTRHDFLVSFPHNVDLDDSAIVCAAVRPLFNGIASANFTSTSSTRDTCALSYRFRLASRSYSSLGSPLDLIVADLQALIRSSSPLKQLGITSRELGHLLPIMLPTTVESDQLNS